MQAGFFAEFAELDRQGSVSGENRQRFGCILEAGHQPVSAALPFILSGASFALGLPAEMLAGQSAAAEGFREGFASFYL